MADRLSVPAASRGRAPAPVEPTPRQLAFWIERGWLHPEGGGKGHPWTWPEQEWAVAVLMARLVAAGFHHGTAADIARAHLTRGGPVDLAPGVQLVSVEVTP